MPSTTSSVVSIDFASSTVIVPSFADLVHGVGDDLADRLVPVGRNGRDLRDLGAIADFLRELSSAPRRLRRHLS
jgi:hypothetical protein